MQQMYGKVNYLYRIYRSIQLLSESLWYVVVVVVIAVVAADATVLRGGQR